MHRAPLDLQRQNAAITDHLAGPFLKHGKTPKAIFLMAELAAFDPGGRLLPGIGPRPEPHRLGIAQNAGNRVQVPRFIGAEEKIGCLDQFRVALGLHSVQGGGSLRAVSASPNIRSNRKNH